MLCASARNLPRIDCPGANPATPGLRPPPAPLSLLASRMSAAASRKPWPMKWVVLAIVALIVPYTFLTLHYRKPGPAFRPYEDTKNRANTVRLLSAGYQRVTLGLHHPADLVRGGAAAEVAAATGGIPTGLETALIDQPLLPVSIDAVKAAGATGATEPYPIQFTCTLADNKAQLTDGFLYHRGTELIVVPTLEKLAGGLLVRNRDNTVVLTVPGGTLQPGKYTVTLVGAHASRRWTLQVH